MTEPKQLGWCRSCRMRYAVTPPEPRDTFGSWNVSPAAFTWIENAARVFDAESPQRFTAAEFVAWIRPDVVGKDAA